MTIPKSYEDLAADLASEKIISKTLLGQKESYMMLADKGRLDLSESKAREAALREELTMSNSIKAGQRSSLDVCAGQIAALQQRLTVAEQRASELEQLLQMFIDNSDDKDVVELSEYALKPAAEGEGS